MTSQPQLPITVYRDQILDLVRRHPAVIVTAETGAGKSTQVPQYLMDTGYTVVCTQPRRLAARSLAQRVAAERNERLGATVGVRTRDDRVVSAHTRLTYATDGLALVRELAGDRRASCLVLDEVHEWSLNVETLVAWSRRRIAEDPSFRVVLMSATIDAVALAEYFGGAPVVQVPGRLHPVEDVARRGSLVDDVERLLRAGRNVLVFQPGRREIDETITELTRRGVDAELIPLHGSLDPEQQARAFGWYPRPKCVVATNVAQTSVTIDDIDAVVDSGFERRTEVCSSVEGLYLRPISRADGQQRRGRAGRTRPGVYVDHCSAAERAEYPTAEILRSRLDQTVLRLAVAGLDAESLQFFHQPRREDITAAKQSLTTLGFLAADGSMTDRGRRAAALPVAPHIAAMVLEAERLGVVSDVLTIAALLESGDITARGGEWRRHCAGETTSDALAQFTLYRAATQMRHDRDLVAAGIHARAYRAARDTRRALADALRRVGIQDAGSGRREHVVHAICAGMISHVYRRVGGAYVGGDAVARDLERDSVVAGAPSIVVGIPWDLQVPTRRGGTMTYRLLRMATAVDPTVLGEVAPHLNDTRTGLRPRYDAAQDTVLSTTEVRFAGALVSEHVVADPSHPEASALFRRWLADDLWWGGYAHPATDHARTVISAARALNHRAGHVAAPIGDRSGIEAVLASQLGGSVCLAEAAPALLALQIDPALATQVERDAPTQIVVADHELVVTYEEYYGPVATVADRVVLDLPDEILLPDGRAVSVATERWWPSSMRDIRELRTRVREAAEESIHRRFEADSPDIELPADAIDQPEIERRVIGISPLDDSPVCQWGVVEPNGSRLETVWCRSVERAQARHERSHAAWADRRERADRFVVAKQVHAAWDALPTEYRLSCTIRLKALVQDAIAGCFTEDQAHGILAEIDAIARQSYEREEPVPRVVYQAPIPAASAASASIDSLRARFNRGRRY